MDIIFIGILFIIGVYVAPFVIAAFFAFLAIAFENIIERFKR